MTSNFESGHHLSTQASGTYQLTHGQGIYSTTNKLNYPELPRLEDLNQNIVKVSQPQAYQPPEEVRIPVHHRKEYIENVVVVERPMIMTYEPYPCIPIWAAWISLLINICLPGFGTIMVGCFPTGHSFYFIFMGLFQFITAFFIIGWIMAIWTSVMLIIFAD
jgi:hypothetical protein